MKIKSKRKYTLSRAAIRQRKAAAAAAAEKRAAATDWRSIRVPAALAAQIETERLKGGDTAAWRLIERALLLI